MKNLSGRWMLLPVLAAFALLLLLPGEAAAGARAGLSVCAGVIVPSLLPFLVFSGLLSAMGLPSLLACRLAPLLDRFGVSPFAAVPLLLGLLGGYPVGADALARLVQSGDLTAEEAERLLPCCNNTGPAFIVGVAGSAVFGSARLGFLLYLCHVLAALLLLPFARSRSVPQSVPACVPPLGFAEAFPACVRAAALSVLNLCAFVVFFSVLTALLRAVGLFSALSAALALWTGIGLQAAGGLLTGLLELGSGISRMSGLPPTPGNLALAAFLLGFGGLSVHCQTLAVTAGMKIRCARHFVGRICHGAVSALLAYVLFTLLQI